MGIPILSHFTGKSNAYSDVATCW